jgi:hypothetical protein
MNINDQTSYSKLSKCSKQSKQIGSPSQSNLTNSYQKTTPQKKAFSVSKFKEYKESKDGKNMAHSACSSKSKFALDQICKKSISQKISTKKKEIF